jgi:hypothetical protein
MNRQQFIDSISSRPSERIYVTRVYYQLMSLVDARWRDEAEALIRAASKWTVARKIERLRPVLLFTDPLTRARERARQRATRAINDSVSLTFYSIG